jgi:hypothetical protein
VAMTCESGRWRIEQPHTVKPPATAPLYPDCYILPQRAID